MKKPCDQKKKKKKNSDKPAKLPVGPSCVITPHTKVHNKLPSSRLTRVRSPHAHGPETQASDPDVRTGFLSAPDADSLVQRQASSVSVSGGGGWWWWGGCTLRQWLHILSRSSALPIPQIPEQRWRSSSQPVNQSVSQALQAAPACPWPEPWPGAHKAVSPGKH